MCIVKFIAEGYFCGSYRCFFITFFTNGSKCVFVCICACACDRERETEREREREREREQIVKKMSGWHMLARNIVSDSQQEVATLR